MSNKSSDKKQTKLRGERWQDKQFFLTKKYKDGLREMIWSRRRFSGNAQHVGLRILDRFASTPTIFANLEKLAGECDMSRPTLRKYMQELSKAGLFRFSTPPYWKRKSGFATEISFPTKAVEKWLRDNGFFMTMERNLPWSKAEKVNKTGVSPAAKLQKTPSTMERNFPSYQEVASAERADTLGFAAPCGYRVSGAPPPRQGKASAEPMANDQANGLGAELECHNGQEKWFPATTERPSNIPPHFALDTRVVWDDSIGCPGIGTVLGYGTHTLTASYLLVQWDDEDSPAWMSCEDVRPSAGNGSANAPVDQPAEANAKEEESRGLGAYYDGMWFPGTTERCSGVFPEGFKLGVRIEQRGTIEKGVFVDRIDNGTIVGFSTCTTDTVETTFAHVLVKWDDPALTDNGLGWMLPSEVSLADTPDTAPPIIPSTTPEPVQKEPTPPEKPRRRYHEYRGGETVRHVAFGDGVVIGVEDNFRVLVRFAARGVMVLQSAFVELVEPAPVSPSMHPLEDDAPAAVPELPRVWRQFVAEAQS